MEWELCADGDAAEQVLPGLDAPPAKPEEVAKYTVRTIMRTTPAAVPGIHFLSGQ